MITKNTIALILLIVALFGGRVCTAQQVNHTDLGWEALLNNNELEAIEHFTAATDANSSDARAYFGLSYVYDLLLDDSSSWVNFRKGLEATPNPYPYIYAAQVSRRFSANLHNPASGVQSVLRHIVDEPDSIGILRAMAIEMLGGIEERSGRINNAKELYASIGSIDRWRLIGPFHNISASGHDIEYGPELEDSPLAVYSGSDGRKVWWFTPPHSRIDGWKDFARHFPTVTGVFYAQTYVKSDERKRVQLRLGTSGAYKLFLNNELVSETIYEHNNDVDTYITEVTLQAGWNRILVKCDNSKLDRCNFLLRITDKQGNPVPALVTSADKQQFAKGSAEPVGIQNPFHRYFEQLIAANPNNLENSLLLVEAHLRNDEVDEAEEVIRKVLKRSPNCIVAMMLALEAYQRSERSDEIIGTIEHITSIRPDLPISLTYAFIRATSTSQLDTASTILEQIHTRLPGTSDYYDAAISLARMKNEMGKVVELQAEAFANHPENVGYAAAAVVMASRSERGYDAALEVADKHLNSNYSESGLLLRASVLEEGKRYSEWEETYNKLFELSPAAPGYHSRKADSYANRKRWTDALASIQLALTDAPYVTWMLYRSGSFKRTLKDTLGAAKDFEKAIECEPANFDAREALRELRKTPSPFSLMAEDNIDSLIRTSPSGTDYPDEVAVVLLNDAKRVVYDGSRCEVRYEYLVRVLNTQGIDRYKELMLPGGGGNTMIVEKAVVIKPGGREVPADREGAYAVFKSLEPGDFVYMRTRAQSSGRGSLAGYFFDEFWVDDYVPVRLARYSLLVPVTENFKWNFSNGAVNQTTTETPQGNLYVWSLENIPPIESEEDMPTYDVIARGLQISSVPKWADIVNWYYDIARTKTRTSYDVRETMSELFPKGTQYSDSAIVSGVYRFITNDIRYSSVPFRQSGIVPQDARDVLVTRIGDCKDVATLCISMLAERNIHAYHVLVKTSTSLLARDPLPSVAFDHAIVMVELDGKNLFLDLTADNVPVGSVPFADLGAFSLLIRRGESAPFRLDKSFFTPNNLFVSTNIELHDDLSALIKQHFVHTGARTQFYRDGWKGAKKSDLERWLKEGLSADLPDVKLINYSIENLDTLLPTLEYTLTYEVPDYTMEASNLLIVRLPWYAPFQPEPALSYTSRTYPCEFTTYLDTVVENLSIALPTGYVAHGIKANESFTSPISTVNRTLSITNDVLRATRQATYKRNVVQVDEYDAYKTYYNNVSRSDRQSLLLLPKGTIIKQPQQRKPKVKK